MNKSEFEIKYVPHMTIGKLNTVNELSEAYDKVCDITQSFETTVDTISIEMIGENEESIIIIEEKLYA